MARGRFPSYFKTKKTTNTTENTTQTIKKKDLNFYRKVSKKLQLKKKILNQNTSQSAIEYKFLVQGLDGDVAMFNLYLFVFYSLLNNAIKN